MYIEQLYTPCLAEAAYYIESNGEAAVIDPLRETSPYVKLAQKRGAKLKYIFETHFHADFVSGHVDLARETGAEIVYGPTAEAGYAITVAADDQVFRLGACEVKVLHTPGHTLESSCFLLSEEDGNPRAVFTGDTLFIGDVGRPDLAVSSSLSKEDLAGMLYESLQDKLLVLPDHIAVYPGHGPGSQCGKNMAQETVSTIGKQKAFNYALQLHNKAEFIEKVLAGQSLPPQYFPKNAQLNKSGYSESIQEVLDRSKVGLSPAQVKQHLEKGALVIDSRAGNVSVQGYLADALLIGMDGFFAVWAGTLVADLNTPIVLVTDDGKEEETILRLARVGYTNVQGYLLGGVAQWENEGHPLETLDEISAGCFYKIQESVRVLDVRTEAEYEKQNLQNSVHMPLAQLIDRSNELDTAHKYYVHCKTGYRSVIACSILKRKGVQVVNISGGIEALVGTKVCAL